MGTTAAVVASGNSPEVLPGVDYFALPFNSAIFAAKSSKR
jgi:hypothetical protein